MLHVLCGNGAHSRRSFIRVVAFLAVPVESSRDRSDVLQIGSRRTVIIWDVLMV